MTLGEDRHEGLSPAGPAEDAQDGMAMATPPLTDGHSIPEEVGSQVLQRRPRGCLPNAAPCDLSNT